MRWCAPAGRWRRARSTTPTRRCWRRWSRARAPRPTDLGVFPTTSRQVKQRLAEAARAFDVIITTGGASRGEEDHVVAALDALGKRHMWQLAIKPGRPMSFGQIGDCVVLGLPGNPVAVLVCFLLYAWPLLRRMGGAEWPEPRRYRLPALFAFPDRKVGPARVLARHAEGDAARTGGRQVRPRRLRPDLRAARRRRPDRHPGGRGGGASRATWWRSSRFPSSASSGARAGRLLAARSIGSLVFLRTDWGWVKKPDPRRIGVGGAQSIMAFIWLLLLSLIFAPTEAAAERKAFVVSVNNYASLDKLQTPQADAAAISDMLKSVGFKVTYAKDPSLSQFNKAWEAFLASVDQTDVVTVYFAGHGIQSNSVNYLLMRDTPKVLQDPPALKKASLDFHELMEQLELKSPLASIYILDACRNNPFATNSRSALGQTKGLAKVEAIYGAFVLYSAGPDEEALDQLGTGDKNSLFAVHLLPPLKDKLVSIVEASKRIQSAVEEAARTKANHKQRPAYFDGILGHFYFADVDNPFRSGRPAPLATSEKVIYMTSGAQWRGKDCHPFRRPR